MLPHPFRYYTGPFIGTNFKFQSTSWFKKSLRYVNGPLLPSSGKNDESDVMNTYIFYHDHADFLEIFPENGICTKLDWTWSYSIK